MSRANLTARTVTVAAVLLVLAPISIRSGYRRLSDLWSDRAIRAAAASPVPAYTPSLSEIVRQDGDRTSMGRETLRVVIAQRGDESRSEQSTYSPGTQMQFSARSIRFADGVFVRAWDVIGLKTSSSPPVVVDRQKVAGSMRARRPTRASGCESNVLGKPFALRYKTEGAGTAPVLNIPAVKLTRSSPDTEAWHAPQIDCEEVYRFVTFKKPDGSIEFSERKAIAFKAGEPDPALFETAILQEASPVTAFVAQYRKIGWPEDRIQTHVQELHESESRYKTAHPE